MENKRHFSTSLSVLSYSVFIIALLAAELSRAEPAADLGNLKGLVDTLNSSSAVYFDFGKSEIKPDAFPLLDSLARYLSKTPDSKIEVTGYTDDIGSDGFNLELSEKRADAVKDYLILKGCSPGQITASGRGKVFNGADENSRMLSRRVDFMIRIPEAEKETHDIDYVNSNIKKILPGSIEAEISARDTTGEPITDLSEADISAVLKWQGDSASGTVHFLPIDDMKKIAFTLVLDYSGSMFGLSKNTKAVTKSDKVKKMENAVKDFCGSMTNNMFAKIIKFGTEIDVIHSFTKSKEIMYDAIDSRSFARDGTALFAAIYSALKDTTYNSNPTIMKTVIAFTDGMDNSSGKIKKDSLYKRSDAGAVKVYTIGLLERNTADITEAECVKGETDLREIAARTGGFFYLAGDAAQLITIYKQIFAQIINSYSISVVWDKSNLPPKGTPVKACLNVKVKGTTRTFYKDYVME